MESSVSSQQRPFKIVVGVDFAPTSRSVLARALAIAKVGSGSQVHVAAVADYDRAMLGLRGAASETPSDAAVRLQELTTSVVGELAPSPEDVHIQRVITHLLIGSPAQELVWLAAHVDADLIVIGTHGRQGISRLLLGSVAERVVRSAGCPVYVVRDKHHDAAWRVPEIEPPCPECLAARNASGGANLWCERHQSHIHAHVYSGAEGSSGVMRPWGFSP